MPRYLSSRWPLYILSLPTSPFTSIRIWFIKFTCCHDRFSEYCYHFKLKFTSHLRIGYPAYKSILIWRYLLELRYAQVHIDIRNNLTSHTMGSLIGLLFRHGVMGSRLLIVNYCCSQCHLIIITYQCEKLECWHSFCYHCKESLKFLLFFCTSKSLFIVQWASSSSHLLLQHLGILFLYNELPLQAAFYRSISTFQFFAMSIPSSHVLLQHLGLSVLCVHLFVLFSLFFEITIAFSSWLSIYVYNVIPNFMKPLKIFFLLKFFSL